MKPAPSDLKSFSSLIEIVAALRGPDGCPWDKEQTHQSLTPYAVEEVFEFVETVETNDDKAMKEELGDVLFQVVLHAQLAQERKAFTIEDILLELNEKMVRRHPHVFGETKVNTSEQVLQNWEAIKKAEKSNKKKNEHFEIPGALPALQRAFKIGKKTNKTGFDWANANDVKAKVLEEMDEVQVASNEGKEEQVAEELGDLLFAVAQYVRHLGHEPESCLRFANRKFEKRYFQMLELCRLKNVDFESLSSDQKEDLWKQVKVAKSNA